MKTTFMTGIIFAFCLGFMSKTVLEDFGYDVVAAAYAEVGGMGYRDLRRDRDFKRAVQYLVEDCIVDEESIVC